MADVLKVRNKVTGEWETIIALKGEKGDPGGGGATTWQELKNKPFEEIGDNLEVKSGKLSVMTTNDMEADNTKPITSAGVHVVVGNIEVLLKSI